MKAGVIPNVSVRIETEQVDVTRSGLLPPYEADYAKKFIPGLTTVFLTINDQEFELTPEEYAESVAEWAEALNLAGRRRA